MPTQGRHTPGEVVLVIHRVVQECPHWSSCRIYGIAGQGFDVPWSRWHVYEESKLDLRQEGENFRGLRAICESFLYEIWGRATTGTYDLFQAIREKFFREILTSYGSAKVFSLESFPLYGISLCKDTSKYQYYFFVKRNTPTNTHTSDIIGSSA